MQIHPLDALLGLHADQRRLGREQRELALRDEAQVGAADLELRLHDLERALVVGQRLRQDPFAIARGESRRRARPRPRRTPQADGRVGGNRLLLFAPSGSRPAS